MWVLVISNEADYGFSAALCCFLTHTVFTAHSRSGCSSLSHHLLRGEWLHGRPSRYEHTQSIKAWKYISQCPLVNYASAIVMMWPQNRTAWRRNVARKKEMICRTNNYCWEKLSHRKHSEHSEFFNIVVAWLVWATFSLGLHRQACAEHACFFVQHQ